MRDVDAGGAAHALRQLGAHRFEMADMIT
jgi:hypothetical protein